VERRFEAIVAKPVWLVLLVAIFIGLPVLALGEVAGNDARSRLRVAEANAAAIGADRAAARIAEQLSGVKAQLAAASQASVTGKLPLLTAAIQSRDVPQMNLLLDTFVSSITPTLPPASLVNVQVLDAGGRLVAGTRPLGGVGTFGFDTFPSELPYAAVQATRDAVLITSIYQTAVDELNRPPGTQGSVPAGAAFVSVAARLSDPGTRISFGSIIVQIHAARFGDALRTQLPAVDESYLVDDRGRLIVRGSRPFTIDPNVLQDMAAEPTVAASLAGPFAGREVIDPFGRGPRLASSARVAEVNWRLINLSLPTVASVELDAALGQQRLVRVGLVALLLVATVLLSRSSRRTMRQRRALAEANVRIEQANAAKSQFLANMSHELRTPLNAIIGFADVLGQKMFGELNEKQADYVSDILSSGRHQLTLINDILDLAKVEAGRMTLEPETFSLRDALTRALAMVRERAAAHQIALDLAMDENVDLITADERKVRQILLNLLSNAVKFTPDGGRIVVTAARDDREVRIAVADSGLGIALEDQARVFEEFAQAQAGRQASEGTGLGLTLSKKIVELHGGRIWVESQVGSGSTFTFALPLLVGRPAS
jgi:signal transduction histidine kinase